MKKGTTHSDETKNKIANANSGRKHTSEELGKMRLAKLGTKHTPEEIEKIRLSKLGSRNPNYGKHPSPETRTKLSVSHSGSRNHQYGNPLPAEVRAKISASLQGERNFNYGKPRESYIVRKIMLSNRIKPNKTELWLESILNTHFPGEWTFVGDGHFIVGGLCPDFLNINNQKAVIELFGTYWHSEKAKRANQTEAGRVRHYAGYGLKCLVIWENELTDEAQLVEKIRTWSSL